MKKECPTKEACWNGGSGCKVPGAVAKYHREHHWATKLAEQFSKGFKWTVKELQLNISRMEK